MSLPTYTSAIDEILQLFKAAWEAGTPALYGGSVVRVEWPHTPKPTPPATTEALARINVRHTATPSQTLAHTGDRLFERTGLITVQVLSPVNRGANLAHQLAVIARDAFEGKGTNSGIWFRNVRINDLGNDAAWNLINVLAEFNYSERK